jgi:hypothetical protein
MAASHRCHCQLAGLGRGQAALTNERQVAVDLLEQPQHHLRRSDVPAGVLGDRRNHLVRGERGGQCHGQLVERPTISRRHDYRGTQGRRGALGMGPTKRPRTSGG